MVARDVIHHEAQRLGDLAHDVCVKPLVELERGHAAGKCAAQAGLRNAPDAGKAGGLHVGETLQHARNVWSEGTGCEHRHVGLGNQGVHFGRNEGSCGGNVATV